MLPLPIRTLSAPSDGEAEPQLCRVKHAALIAYVGGESSFDRQTAQTYSLDEDGNILLDGDHLLGYVSRFVVQSKENGVDHQPRL